MKTYKIKTSFVFDGYFEVVAENKSQAREFVGKHCGLVIGGDIRSTLPDDMVNWEFDVHPKKVIS